MTHKPIQICGLVILYQVLYQLKTKIYAHEFLLFQQKGQSRASSTEFHQTNTQNLAPAKRPSPKLGPLPLTAMEILGFLKLMISFFLLNSIPTSASKAKGMILKRHQCRTFDVSGSQENADKLICLIF